MKKTAPSDGRARATKRFKPTSDPALPGGHARLTVRQSGQRAYSTKPLRPDRPFSAFSLQPQEEIVRFEKKCPWPCGTSTRLHRIGTMHGRVGCKQMKFGKMVIAPALVLGSIAAASGQGGAGGGAGGAGDAGGAGAGAGAGSGGAGGAGAGSGGGGNSPAATSGQGASSSPKRGETGGKNVSV
ncbi:hypothetical protein ABIF68_003980 [Bradyrhizobium japonicum]